MKHNLKFKIDYDLNFIIIGVQSEMKDYQFGYFLNNQIKDRLPLNFNNEATQKIRSTILSNIRN